MTEEKLLALAEKHYERGIHWLHQAELADQQGVCASLASAYFGAGSLALAVRSARLSVAVERELSIASGKASHLSVTRTTFGAAVPGPRSIRPRTGPGRRLTLASRWFDG